MKLITKLLELAGRFGKQPGTTEQSSAIASEREFYEEFFVKNPEWNTKTPNVDEAARWDKIQYLLEKYYAPSSRKRILDVGCGRGWLTNLLSRYGDAMGIEPVEPVVKHAREMFPKLRFEVGTPAGFEEGDTFDLVVSSEVIEHVTDKPAFIGHLRRLLRKGGLLIITTPRGELYEAWTNKFAKPSQPIEEWISTDSLCELLTQKGFRVLESTSAFEMGIYQIHACRREN